MWIIIAVSLLAIAYLVYAYGIFQPMALESGDLNNPLFVYYSWKGPKESIGNQFINIHAQAEKHFKLSNAFGIYYSLPEKELWDCVLGVLVNQGEKHNVDAFIS